MVSLIVAHANQNVIGFKGDMPWHLPNDLKHVKALTENKTIVMGRKTFESLGRPLPNRKNVILTRDMEYQADGAEIIHDINDVAQLKGEIFIFGGSNIYQATMHLVDEMHITRIYETFAGDTFFPEYNPDDWTVADITEGTVDGKNRYPHSFIHFKRVSS